VFQIKFSISDFRSPLSSYKNLQDIFNSYVVLPNVPRPALRPHSFPADLIPTGIDEYNKKIMVDSIKDPDLFRVNNKFAHDRYIKRLGSNPLVERCGTNPALRVSYSTYHDG
jgi:hypothetical protein